MDTGNNLPIYTIKVKPSNYIKWIIGFVLFITPAVLILELKPIFIVFAILFLVAQLVMLYYTKIVVYEDRFTYMSSNLTNNSALFSDISEINLLYRPDKTRQEGADWALCISVKDNENKLVPVQNYTVEDLSSLLKNACARNPDIKLNDRAKELKQYTGNEMSFSLRPKLKYLALGVLIYLIIISGWLLMNKLGAHLQ